MLSESCFVFWPFKIYDWVFLIYLSSSINKNTKQKKEHPTCNNEKKEKKRKGKGKGKKAHIFVGCYISCSAPLVSTK